MILRAGPSHAITAPGHAREAATPVQGCRVLLDDRCRLGGRVKLIVLRGADELHEIPVEHLISSGGSDAAGGARQRHAGDPTWSAR
jgi:hypothetical protein